MQRGLTVTAHPQFDLFVSPGRAWRDGRRDRASLPFTLLSRSVNCTHNGLVTFAYTADSIDDVEVLVNQETCHFIKADIWGKAKGSYTPGPVVDAQALRSAYATERANRIPTESFADLASKYAIDLDLLMTGLPTDHNLTTAGVFIDGIHFSNGCSTRSGPYPYCEHMLLTSFSTAKTAFPAVVLMTLAKDLGIDVYRSKIVDYLPAAARAPGDWQTVTFNHVGDMTSGNYTNPSPLADAGPGDFYADLDRAGKLNAAFSWPNGAPAGTRFVYQTGDTFILVNALDAYLRRHTDSVDSYDYLVQKVLRPLHVAPEVLSTRRTRDDGKINSGTAFGGMGMWWTADAMVKVAKLLNVDAGRIDDVQVLDPGAVAATMQRDPADRGIDMQFYGFWYNNGTWAYPATRLGRPYDCDVWVPFMSGLSGVRTLMFPNGMTFYYFNDNQQFPYAEAVEAAHAVRSLCANR